MLKCDVIALVCEALSKGQLDESKEIIKGKYPFDMVETKQGTIQRLSYSRYLVETASLIGIQEKN